MDVELVWMMVMLGVGVCCLVIGECDPGSSGNQCNQCFQMSWCACIRKEEDRGHIATVEKNK